MKPLMLLILIVGIVLLAACTVPSATTPVSKAQEIFQQLKEEGKVLEVEPGHYRLAMVLMHTPRPNPDYCKDYSTIQVPPPSATWDCDDDALYMYNYLTDKDKGGFEKGEVTIVVGDLDVENEDILRLQFDHVWIILNIKIEEKHQAVLGGKGYWLAYDWGKPCCDEQHYEGCPITYEELLQTVEYDKKQR